MGPDSKERPLDQTPWFSGEKTIGAGARTVRYTLHGEVVRSSREETEQLQPVLQSKMEKEGLRFGVVQSVLPASLPFFFHYETVSLLSLRLPRRERMKKSRDEEKRQPQYLAGEKVLCIADFYLAKRDPASR